MRFQFIEAKKTDYPLSLLCQTLKVSRSGFYAWRDRPESARSQANRSLGEQIRAIHVQSRHNYGSPRIHDALQAQGQRVGRQRVARLMRQMGLQGRVRRRRWRPASSTEAKAPVAANHLDRQFQVSAPESAWVGDITYIWTQEGWLYLAVVLDLYSRRVVGWSMSEHPDTDLTLAALEMACQGRQSSTPELLYHSDRGCQYTSRRYRQYLEAQGLQASMSRVGNCWDNAVAESFFATLKVELVQVSPFANRAQARQALFEYIEVFYNRQRSHSSLDYLCPLAYERRYYQQSAQTA